ncbi:MAG: DUF2069 domain-containing protein [Xanthomonadales bacterium]|nr:DUF2069 domain-containing protein [Xanthomonadales bacterium]
MPDLADPPQARNAPPALTLGEALPAAALCAQALLQVLWHALLHPPRPLPTALVLTLVLLPLLALVPAALHSRRRALLVGGIVSLLYFSHGVMELWSNPPLRTLAAIEIALALLAVFGLRRSPARA